MSNFRGGRGKNEHPEPAERARSELEKTQKYSGDLLHIHRRKFSCNAKATCVINYVSHPPPAGQNRILM